MKKSELLGRIELLESRLERATKNIEKIREDIFHGYQDFFGWSAYSNLIPTYTKIKKILEHLGIEIYEKASEIKIRSIKPKKEKKSK